MDRRGKAKSKKQKAKIRERRRHGDTAQQSDLRTAAGLASPSVTLGPQRLTSCFLLFAFCFLLFAFLLFP
jgi:hypothetical protein